MSKPTQRETNRATSRHQQGNDALTTQLVHEIDRSGEAHRKAALRRPPLEWAPNNRRQERTAA